jgi:hypothetical protein
MNSPQAAAEVDSGSMHSNRSFFLDILESLWLDILDGIVLDWICPFAWAYDGLHEALDFASLAGYELQAAMRA